MRFAIRPRSRGLKIILAPCQRTREESVRRDVRIGAKDGLLLLIIQHVVVNADHVDVTGLALIIGNGSIRTRALDCTTEVRTDLNTGVAIRAEREVVRKRNLSALRTISINRHRITDSRNDIRMTRSSRVRNRRVNGSRRIDRATGSRCNHNLIINRRRRNQDGGLGAIRRTDGDELSALRRGHLADDNHREVRQRTESARGAVDVRMRTEVATDRVIPLLTIRLRKDRGIVPLEVRVRVRLVVEVTTATTGLADIRLIVLEGDVEERRIAVDLDARTDCRRTIGGRFRSCHTDTNDRTNRDASHRRHACADLSCGRGSNDINEPRTSRNLNIINRRQIMKRSDNDRELVRSRLREDNLGTVAKNNARSNRCRVRKRQRLPRHDLKRRAGIAELRAGR